MNSNNTAPVPMLQREIIMLIYNTAIHTVAKEEKVNLAEYMMASTDTSELATMSLLVDILREERDAEAKEAEHG